MSNGIIQTKFIIINTEYTGWQCCIIIINSAWYQQVIEDLSWVKISPPWTRKDLSVRNLKLWGLSLLQGRLTWHTVQVEFRDNSMGLIQRSSVGKRYLCLEEPPWEASWPQGRRSLPWQLKEGSFRCRIYGIKNKVVGSESNCSKWKWMSETPCTPKFLSSLINEPWKSHLLLMLWSVFQAHVHRCSVCHSAPLWFSWRSSWSGYSSGFASSEFWTKLLLVWLRGRVNPSEQPR